MKRNDKRLAEYKSAFEDYFNSYYASNRQVSNLSFREMLDEKQKLIGYTAQLEYKNFRQNVNVYWDNMAPVLINSIFTFRSSMMDFCCHFDDVLDYYDSDDLSFYTYTHCTDNDKTINALNNIMSATKKYWNKLNDIASSYEKCDSIFKSVYSDELDLDEIDDASFDKVEEATDFTFVVYELTYSRDKLKRHLTRLAKKDKLETAFEKRAYRVLKRENTKDTRKIEKQRAKAHSYSKSDKQILGVIIGVVCAAFAAIFAYAGYKLDSIIFEGWIGLNMGDTVSSFGFIGALTGLIFSGVMPVKILKPFVSKRRYDSLEAYSESDRSSSLAIKIIACIGYVLICAFFITFFCFNGIGFSNNGEIKYKEYVYSSVETYQLDEIDIAIVKGTYDNSYSEYSDTAYAFKLGDKWVEYGIPNEDARPIIEKAIEGKNINSYDTIDDIKD